MRNLTLSAVTLTEFQNANISTTAIDVDENVIYTTSEKLSQDGEVEVEIWKIGKEEKPSAFAMFVTVASSRSSPSLQVLSLRVLPETRRLSVIMRNGDITMVTLGEDDPSPEVEGTVEPGILAASWSPDESLLALVTDEEKLILMTSTFDVLSENVLHTADFGEDVPANVGWGSKQTQFHGSLGKTAAQAPGNVYVGSSPDDDGLPRVSWRGDGAYFVVSALSPVASNNFRRRILRVYDREAILQSTSETVPGLEHPLVWRPSGNLIVGSQRFGFDGGGAGRDDRHDIVFFERNGLRHGEFRIRPNDLGLTTKAVGKQRKWGYKVRELSWSSDSNVLGIWVEQDEGDIVQLWTTGNYHWYLKQEISAPVSSAGRPCRFTSVAWHPEQALRLILTTSSTVIQRSYAWETSVSPSKPPIDSGIVAVFDGTNILLTPFRVQNVPPPMSSFQLTLSSSELPSSPERSRTPIHASLSALSDTLAVLWEAGYVELWSLKTRLEDGRAKIMDPSRSWAGFVGGALVRNCRQVLILSSDTTGTSSTLVVLSSDREHDVITIVALDSYESIRGSSTVSLPHRNCRLVMTDTDKQILCQGPTGEILRYDPEQNQLLPVIKLPGFCLQSQSVSLGLLDADFALTIYIGLGNSGKLHVASSQSAHVLASNATSFTIASGFVIYTTTAHEVVFAPLDALPSLLSTSDSVSKDPLGDWPTRRVERGSRIVVAVSSSMSLVLQMPRGNLETINPRPLVMEVVKQDIDAGNHRKAFLACRKHRIDLNFIVDYDLAKFLEDIPSFVEQVDEVDHINLLLTGLGRGSQPPETIARLCDAIRLELERKDLAKYVNSILTAHLVKTPPDHEAGLALLLRLRESDSSLVEDAVKYIIFLVDADRLFDTALGMYDFSLVLMIAQHAQKDPREYLPFLRELRSLEKYYQRFRIDDHLKRHESALRNLSLAGHDHFDEAVAYVELHRLYEAALRIWKNTDRYNSILELYGDWLFERREFRQAAAVFTQAQSLSKAMLAHERALEWQELFDLAVRTSMAEGNIVTTGYRIAEDLVAKKRHSEAARVLLDYSKDIREAVIALVQGNHFSEARRVTTLTSNPELLADVIYSAASDSCAQIIEDINECREQLQKQLNRLRELRIKKVEDPDAFYGTEDATLHNVDVMTDVSMPATEFTRYTVAPTSVSRSSSKRSSRSKRKLDRKVGSGRKGTIDEEEYLFKSVSKLVSRIVTIQDEARGLLPHLLQFTEEHREEGLSMQRLLLQFETELKDSLDEIWARPPEETPPLDSWALRVTEAERDRKVNLVDKVPKPIFPSSGWKVTLFDEGLL